MSTHDYSELYQQVILDHNRSPRNFGVLDTATHKAEGDNPLCGDHYNITLTLNEQKIISEIMFDGHGCAISKASSSLMTTFLKGKHINEAFDLFDKFQKLVKGEDLSLEDMSILGKLSVFSGIWQYPARVKCAILSWHTMRGAIEHQNGIVTTE